MSNQQEFQVDLSQYLLISTMRNSALSLFRLKSKSEEVTISKTAANLGRELQDHTNVQSNKEEIQQQKILILTIFLIYFLNSSEIPQNSKNSNKQLEQQVFKQNNNFSIGSGVSILNKYHDGRIFVVNILIKPSKIKEKPL
ncbi:hypothetical protein ABPG72_001700 [Tetrahymena utriculariae]